MNMIVKLHVNEDISQHKITDSRIPEVVTSGQNSVVPAKELEKIFDHHYKWYQKKIFRVLRDSEASSGDLEASFLWTSSSSQKFFMVIVENDISCLPGMIWFC